MESSQEIQNVSEIQINLVGYPEVSMHTVCDDCLQNYKFTSKGKSGITIRKQIYPDASCCDPVPVPKNQDVSTKVMKMANRWEQLSTNSLTQNRKFAKSTGEIRNSTQDTNIEL
ncbi:hypothetical protein L9F63_014981, partial [Diploptera punctata]